MRSLALSLGLLLLAAGANAQDWRYREGGRYSGDGLIDRVRADLDRAESHFDWRGADRRRFDRAREELAEFQGKWNRGRFDRGELDDAISAVQHIADHNRLPFRDRQILQDDANRLRSFRAARGYERGYDRGYYPR